MGGVDTQPPSAPGTLTASVVSAGEIDLSWGTATDNVGVTGYQVERCTGAACSNFAQINAVTGTTFNDTSVAASTSYTYRVRATDAAGNLSPYTNTAGGVTPALDSQPPSQPGTLWADQPVPAKSISAGAPRPTTSASPGTRSSAAAAFGCSQLRADGPPQPPGSPSRTRPSLHVDQLHLPRPGLRRSRQRRSLSRTLRRSRHPRRRWVSWRLTGSTRARGRRSPTPRGTATTARSRTAPG